MTDPRLVRPSWRGRTNVDALTIAVIEAAEKKAGHQFVVTQGSYQSGVAASAGTHDRGGAVDLRWCGHDSCVRALREAGAWAWHRTPAQGPWGHHIHFVVKGHPNLAPSAARQVVSGEAGRNGLANNGPDDGPRVKVPTPKLPDPTLAVVHASLKHSAKNKVVAKYIATLAFEHEPDIITTTEAQGLGKVRAVQGALGAGWVVRRKGEYMVAWRKATVYRRGTPSRTRLTRQNALAAWRDLWVASFPLVHRETGKRLNVEVGHLAAGVESGPAYRVAKKDAKAVLTHRRGLYQWAKRVKAMPSGVIPVLCMDANVDQKNGTWKQTLERRLGVRSMWSGFAPKRGTHGKRLIDTIHAPLEARRAPFVSPLIPPKPIDHKAVVARFKL